MDGHQEQLVIIGPIHFAQTENDEPLYSKIWNDPESCDRVCLEMNNWEQTPEIWNRRFNESKERRS